MTLLSDTAYPLLHWRSGGVEHHHDTPPYPVTPSPTSGHSSADIEASVFSSRVTKMRLVLGSAVTVSPSVVSIGASLSCSTTCFGETPNLRSWRPASTKTGIY